MDEHIQLSLRLFHDRHADGICIDFRVRALQICKVFESIAPRLNKRFNLTDIRIFLGRDRYRKIEEVHVMSVFLIRQIRPICVHIPCRTVNLLAYFMATSLVDKGLALHCNTDNAICLLGVGHVYQTAQLIQR